MTGTGKFFWNPKDQQFGNIKGDNGEKVVYFADVPHDDVDLKKEHKGPRVNFQAAKVPRSEDKYVASKIWK